MKQVKSLYNSNSQELLGRVTLSGKNLFNRSAYVLVTNERNAPKGYKAIIPRMIYQISHPRHIFK